MRVETKKTSQGTEYWDAIEKRTIFVPAGKDPDFEVTENPKSMVMSVDTAADKVKTAVNEKVVTPLDVNDGETDYQLNDMKIKDLKELAVKYEIEVPKEVTKRDDIAQYIFDNWVPEDTE